MRALTATAVVNADHILKVQVPADVPCGAHEVVIVFGGAAAPSTATREWRLPVHDVGPWPEGFTARREDLYGDDGR